MQNEYSKILSFCHFCKRCHVRFNINWVQDFDDFVHLTLYLTRIFFWLNTENNANPYVTKPANLSSTGKCDNEPHDTLFSWFGPMLFLLHQSDNIDHSWPLAMDHICKNKKPSLYVHKKKLAQNFPVLLSLDKWKCMSFICVLYPFSLTS